MATSKKDRIEWAMAPGVACVLLVFFLMCWPLLHTYADIKAMNALAELTGGYYVLALFYPAVGACLFSAIYFKMWGRAFVSLALIGIFSAKIHADASFITFLGGFIP